LRRTSIERYAEPLDLVFVIPDMHLSSYTDDARGLRDWSFVSEEPPAIMGSLFRSPFSVLRTISEYLADLETSLSGLSGGW